MRKITPFLWFDDQAAEAAGLYASISESSKTGKRRAGARRQRSSQCLG
jgi:predicted 3-demethylubiquinone-9 3-methyltransferase (glyoxalase superfamily)